MQTLNCKVGDLAIVVKAQLQENLGQIVEVIGIHRGEPIHMIKPYHVWQSRTIHGRETLHYRQCGRDSRYAEGPIPDACLRPISGIPESEELIASLGLPRIQEDASEEAAAHAVDA